MHEQIVAATVQALKRVTRARFFRTERGYQGEFYCALRSELDKRKILSDEWFEVDPKIRTGG